MDARSKQEWERRARQWEERGRFEELDSEDDDPARAEYDEYTYDEEDDELGDFDDPGDEWQLAMREKEDELAERAMRRIRRARIRGESNVDLSREELDALEKRRYREEAARRPPRRSLPPSRQRASLEAPPPKSKRKSSSSSLNLGGPSKPKSSSRSSKATTSVPVTDYNPATSPMELQAASGYFPRSANVSPRASRVSSRASLNARSPQSQLQLSPNDSAAPGYHRPSSSRSSARRSDVSPTRSLPDDPNWMPGPRSRSSSSAQLYKPSSNSPPPPLPPGPDPYAYQTGGPSYAPGRRIVSDPSAAGVSYSSVRRNPPITNRASAGTSGLGREVVEISSEDGEDEKDESSDDEGVRVDVVPDDEVDRGYSMAVARPTANAARPRKGRR